MYVQFSPTNELEWVYEIRLFVDIYGLLEIENNGDLPKLVLMCSCALSIMLLTCAVAFPT